MCIRDRAKVDGVVADGEDAEGVDFALDLYDADEVEIDESTEAVSYTHLDVYKRQTQCCIRQYCW